MSQYIYTKSYLVFFVCNMQDSQFTCLKMALPPWKRSHVFLAKFCIGTEEMHTRFWMIRTRRSCMTQVSVGSKEWTCWWFVFSSVLFGCLKNTMKRCVYIVLIYTWLLLFLVIWENLTLNSLLCKSEGQKNILRRISWTFEEHTWHGSVIAPFSCLEPRVSPKTERLALEFCRVPSLKLIKPWKIPLNPIQNAGFSLQMIILKNIFHQSLENTWRIMDSSAQNLLTLYEFQPNTNTSVLDDPRIVFPANWLDKTSFTQICYSTSKNKLFTLSETNSSHLKLDRWKTIWLPFGSAYLQGAKS